MKLIISGPIPSQKNNKRILINRKTRKPFIASNERVINWKRLAVAELKQQWRGLKITNYPIKINLVFYFNNLLRHDLDNAAAGVMDALKGAEIVEDDCVKYINCLTLQYGGCDRKKPRVEIFLED